jgi:hypothetical protein
MTRRNNAVKRAARARSRAAGIPYSVARRPEAEQARELAPPEIARPRNINELLHEYVESWCAQQLGEPVTENLWLDPDVNAVLGVEIDELTVHELTANKHQTDSFPIEEFEGGTLLSTVTATARLTIDGLMDRGAAAGADGTLVDVLNEAWNDHYAAVVARTAVEVELEFSATTNPDYESIEDFEFVSATVLGREER